jgi:hypothetical protein
MASRSTPHLPKHRIIRKTPKSSTQHHTTHHNKHAITNFMALIRSLEQPTHPLPTNPLISFLSTRKAQEEVSHHYIPSIENMISEQHIEEEDAGFSKSLI